MESLPKKYELVELSEEFRRHAVNDAAMMDFNLPSALKSVVDEVLRLGRELEEVKRRLS